MLSNENSFRLWSVGLLGVFIISLTAIADSNEEVSTIQFPVVGHIEEAEQINDNHFHASRLTTVGNSTEIVVTEQKKQ